MRKWLVISAIVLFTIDCDAQYKNVKMDEASMEGKFSNPTVAISKKDLNKVAATGLNDVLLTSIDGGLTWKKSKMTTPPLASDDRVLLSDSKGMLITIQSTSPDEGKSSQIIYTQSKDDGQTWDAASPISPDPTKYQTLPAATIDAKGNIIVTWTQFDKFPDQDSTCRSIIYLSTSSSGKKWSKPVELSQYPGNCLNDSKTVTGAMPAVGPDGKMFVTWFGAGKILMDRSFGSGMWLQNDITIRTQDTPLNLKISGHAEPTSLPQVIIDQSKGTYKGCIYVVWADEQKGENDSDVWFFRSNNHGDNWSSALRLGNGAPSRHQYAPRITIDQLTGFIYVLYYDRGEYDNDQTDVYLSYSSDSGANFKAVKISESPFIPDEKGGMGFYLNIAAHNGLIVPVWSRMDNGTTSLMSTTIKQEELVKPPDVKQKKKK